jgi:hypothetical protein
MSLSAIWDHPAPQFRAADLGYRLFYHRNSVNHCPGCGQTQWFIGRVSAECAFCATALPLQEIVSRDARPIRHLGVGGTDRYKAHPA